ncbi:hypothetical protein RDWZM_004930 [Blomia tropicalis]|uniref:Uncharacterized protein n=1 Tax=Blomia tropicalis TaxID=40697 RepID=A0A9Q0M5Q2_BLOTA|nr:hypothetical protein BLOT_014241 [Blomia tropicalis]KAJ6219118.1 hypothetical protein RDWZM_004930 [Blomia tropicalis]
MPFKEGILRTPTKRPYQDDLDPTNVMASPKFIKPSDVFRKRARRSLKLSPAKANSSRLCALPLETVVRKKNYSPLKCLQTSNSTNSIDSKSSSISGESNCSDNVSNKKEITFSPLMKKLQRSPARSAIQFPIVKRGLGSGSGSASKSSGTLKRSHNSNAFSRVLDFSEDANFFPDKFDSPTKTNNSTSEFNVSLNAPNIDWSLKTKIRIIINRPIPFHGNFKPIDESNGLCQFVQGDRSSNDIDSGTENFSAQLHRHCLIWQHPSLPWIKRELFPRVSDLKSASQASKSTFNISPASPLADSLYSDFCVSLYSLFKLVKSKHCPYFYLCSNNFTVLFRASGVAGSNDAHALISPTTYGFRKLLKDEEITYSMPFHQDGATNAQSNSLLSSDTSASSASTGTFESSELDNEECIDIIDDDTISSNPEENDEWLESLGLSQKDFPSLDSVPLRRRRMMQTNGRSKRNSSEIDDHTAEGKMKSLIRIDGIMNCHSLVNMFINQRKICISTSGVLSGVPPTLLSPVAFHGATLVPLSVRHKVSEESRAQPLVSVDIVGPILPHTLYGLSTLFGRFTTTSIGSNVTMVRSSMRTFDSSSSFALEIGQPRNVLGNGQSNDSTFNATFAVENLEESGIDKRFLTAICTADRQLASPLVDFELTPNGIRYNRSIHGTKHK